MRLCVPNTFISDPLQLKCAFVLQMHSNEAFFNSYVPLNPQTTKNKALFKAITFLHPQTTKKQTFFNSNPFLRPRYTQIRLFNPKYVFFPPNTLTLKPLELKCAFALSINSNDLQYSKMCPIAFNKLK